MQVSRRQADGHTYTRRTRRYPVGLLSHENCTPVVHIQWCTCTWKRTHKSSAPAVLTAGSISLVVSRLCLRVQLHPLAPVTYPLVYSAYCFYSIGRAARYFCSSSYYYCSLPSGVNDSSSASCVEASWTRCSLILPEQMIYIFITYETETDCMSCDPRLI
jgi:hypothetical protein